MSNLDLTPALTACGGLAAVAPRPVHEVFAGKDVALGESTIVRRLLPNLGRRLVGPWCFIDHYGPDDVADSTGMAVPPHPHIGLQTVSWLLDGRIHHTDSLGSDQVIAPGELGLMSAGRGIAHAEYSPAPHPRLLHGAQLWVALPGSHLSDAPSWEHHADLPAVHEPGLTATVIMGEFAGATSPGRSYSPIVGADLAVAAGASVTVPLEPEFEHAVGILSGSAEVDGVALPTGSLLYLGCSRRDLAIRSEPGARLLVLGGAPFAEQIVMWWNFVGRDNDEIVAARQDWLDGTRFGTVPGGVAPLAAPSLPPGRLKPGGSAR